VDLLPKQCEEQCQNKADQNGGGQREIERELFSFNQKVTGESSEPGKFIAGHQKQTHQDDKDSQQNKKFA
jgi:hypothetical protein